MNPEVLAGLNPVSRAEVWHQFLSSRPHKVVVTERAGQVIGFASYGPSARDPLSPRAALTAALTHCPDPARP